jgi:hypothetical protein
VQYLTDGYRGATLSLEQALVLYRDLGDRRGEANALNYLGAVQLGTIQPPPSTWNRHWCSTVTSTTGTAKPAPCATWVMFSG